MCHCMCSGWFSRLPCHSSSSSSKRVSRLPSSIARVSRLPSIARVSRLLSVARVSRLPSVARVSRLLSVARVSRLPSIARVSRLLSVARGLVSLCVQCGYLQDVSVATSLDRQREFRFEKIGPKNVHLVSIKVCFFSHPKLRVECNFHPFVNPTHHPHQFTAWFTPDLLSLEFFHVWVFPCVAFPIVGFPSWGFSRVFPPPHS